MTSYLVERLAELRRHLDHLATLRPRVRTKEDLERLPGFRNVLIHEYVALDLRRAVEAMDQLEPVERFLKIVASEERRG